MDESMTDGGKLVNVNIDLSNLEGLSDSVKVFVQRVSDEIGAFTKPYHVKRIAQAKADAAIVSAETKLKITDIQARGLQRMVVEEGKRQENIEAIANKAIPFIEEKSHADQLDSDWLGNFFEKCRLASDEQTQNAFAQLLAQESNTPNSIAKRTVNVLAQMDKKDAQLFQKFCQFAWVMGGLTPIVYEINEGIPAANGINFNTMSHLDDIGLIKFHSVGGFKRLKLPKHVQINYYGRALILEFPSDENDLDFGFAKFTDVGIQLAPISQSRPSQEYYETIVSKLFSLNIGLSSHINGQSF
jgi:hypothetical protein